MSSSGSDDESRGHEDCPPVKKKKTNDSRPLLSSSANASSSTINKRKFAGAAKFKTRFQPSWTKKWPCIVGVTGSDYEFKCTVCCKIISCSHQGEADVSRHLEGAKHKERVKNATSSKGLFACGFRKESDPIKEQVSCQLYLFFLYFLNSVSYVEVVVGFMVFYL